MLFLPSTDVAGDTTDDDGGACLINPTYGDVFIAKQGSAVVTAPSAALVEEGKVHGGRLVNGFQLVEDGGDVNAAAAAATADVTFGIRIVCCL